MPDILLTHCNHLFFDRKQVRKMQPYPPLQTLIAAAALRSAGHSVAFFDSTFADPATGFAEALRIHRPRVVAICEDNFNFLTKMCLTQARDLAFEFRRLAGPDVTMIVNSSDATDRAAAYLRAGFDFVITGELEASLLELCSSLLTARTGPDTPGNAQELDPAPSSGSVVRASSSKARTGPDSPTNAQARRVAGLAFAGPLGVEYTPPRAPLREIDSLPFPAWDLLDVESYRRAWQEAHGYFSLNLVTSRGCPFHCNWCAKPLYGQTYRVRSPRLAAQEMREIKARFAPDHIWFADDIFALSPKWTEDFAAHVEALDAAVPFKMQSRCDLMTPASVEALRRAGCAEVWMGVESGSQQVLDAMEKGTSVGQVREASDRLRRQGIRPCFFLQFGFPGEGPDDIRRTVQLVRDARPHDIGVSVAYPLPGTKFHQLVSGQLNGKTNWTDSDDLAMMFRGAYKSDYYRALRDALHLEVETLQGRAGEGAQRLREHWSRVEALEPTCRNPDATPLWTCC